MVRGRRSSNCATARLVALGINALLIMFDIFFMQDIDGKSYRAAIMVVKLYNCWDKYSLISLSIWIGCSARWHNRCRTGFCSIIDPNGGQDISLIGFIIIVLGGLGHPVGH